MAINLETQNRRARLCRAFIVGSSLALLPVAASANGAPPALELDVSSVLTGACAMEGPGGEVSGGASRAVSLSYLNRHPIAAQGWYWSCGLQADNYCFGAGPGLPRRLQDYAGVLSLEYFQGDESVAALSVQPGLYFETHASASAWDVPVNLTVALPVTRAIDGVVGFSNARFYHSAVPILGLEWTLGPQARLELTYPEPALVVDIGAASTLRLGGELAGAGFLSDPTPVRTPIEYESYRVGAEWTWKPHHGCELAIGSGVEAERSFDYFRQRRLLHGSRAGYLTISATFTR